MVKWDKEKVHVSNMNVLALWRVGRMVSFKKMENAKEGEESDNLFGCLVRMMMD